MALTKVKINLGTEGNLSGSRSIIQSTKTLVSSSAQLATDISGSFTAASSSFSTRVATMEGSGTAQGVGTSDSPTFNNITATGTVTAQEFHSEFVSASITYTSGSHKFGDSSDDVHSMTGSLNISGSFGVNDGNVHIVDKMIVGSGSGFDFSSDSNAFVVAAPGNNAGLQVVNQTGGQLMQFRQSNNNAGDLILYGAGTTKVRFSSNGSDTNYINTGTNVGIGTTSPSEIFHVQGTGVTDRFARFESTNYDMFLYIDADSGNSNSDADVGIIFRNNNSEVFRIGIDDSDDSFHIATGTFGTASNKKLTIDSSGNVGIGTTSPASKLHIYSSAANEVRVERSTSGNAGIHYKNTNDDWYAGITSQQDFSISQNADIASGTEFRIQDETGNVGIGTTSPGHLLTVAGATDGDNPSIHIIAHSSDSGSIWFGESATNKNGGIEYDNSGQDMYFTTNSSRKMTLDTSGNLGIGDTSPSAKLTINGGINNVYSYSTTTTDQPGFVAANHESSYTNLLYSKIYGSGISASAFGVTLGNYGICATDGSANNGLIVGTFSNTPIIIGTNSTERMRIQSDGVIVSQEGIEFQGNTLTGSQTGISSSGSGGELLLFANGSAHMRIEPGGDVRIANGGRFDAADSSQRARLHWAHFSTTLGNRYWHLKTDINWGGTTQMYSVQFLGHAYNTSSPINASLVWYNYSPSSAPISIGSSGTHSSTLYQSSDGKIVIRIDLTAGGTYYSAFTITSLPTRQGCVNFSITATAATNATDTYA